MRSLFSHLSSRSLGAITARTVGVVLLTPLILLAGIVAVGVLAAISLSRHPALRTRAARRPAARPVMLRLEPAPAEPALGGGVRRVA